MSFDGPGILGGDTSGIRQLSRCWPVFVITASILALKQVLTWKDPLLVAQQAASGQKASSVAPVPVPESKPAPAAAAAELPPVAAPAAASS